MKPTFHQAQRGALMIEVLVTIVILAIGLLGLMQLQGRLQKSEMESYQRTQAIMLVNDMASRIATNRVNASGYLTGTGSVADPDSVGDGDCSTLPASSPPTRQQSDMIEWCYAIQGAAESLDNAAVGALINGRGCVYDPTGSGAEYLVAVVWQGLTPIGDPNNPSSLPPIACGKESPNPYDTVGTDCQNDLCRRYLTTVVGLGNLPP